MRPIRSALLVLALLAAACRDHAERSRTGPTLDAAQADGGAAASATADGAGSTRAGPSATAAPAPTDGPGVDGGTVTALAWQQRATRIAFARAGWITLLEPSNPAGAIRIGPQEGPILSIVWSDDGTLLVTGSKDGTIRLWNASGGPPRALLASGQTMHGRAFSHDGRLFAAALEDSRLDWATSVWNTETGALLPAKAFETPMGPYWVLAFLADNRQLVGFDALAVTVWDVHTGKRTGGRSFETGATSPVMLSPDGTFAASALGQHGLVAWRLGPNPVVFLDRAKDCEDHIGGLTFSPDSRVLTMRTSAGRLGSWNLPSLSPRSAWKSGQSPDQQSAFLSDDGALVVRVGADGSADLVDAFNGRRLRALEGRLDRDAAPTFSADHRWMAQGGPSAAVWDVTTGTRVPL